jgi:hypothetical protein
LPLVIQNVIQVPTRLHLVDGISWSPFIPFRLCINDPRRQTGCGESGKTTEFFIERLVCLYINKASATGYRN